MEILETIFMIMITIGFSLINPNANFTGIGASHPLSLFIYTLVLSLFFYKKTAPLQHQNLRKVIALSMILSTLIPYGINIHLNLIHVLLANLGTVLFLGLLTYYYYYQPLFQMILFTTAALILCMGHISLLVEVFLVIALILFVSR